MGRRSTKTNKSWSAAFDRCFDFSTISKDELWSYRDVRALDPETAKAVTKLSVAKINSARFEYFHWLKFKAGALSKQTQWPEKVFVWRKKKLDLCWDVLDGHSDRHFVIQMALYNTYCTRMCPHCLLDDIGVDIPILIDFVVKGEDRFDFAELRETRTRSSLEAGRRETSKTEKNIANIAKSGQLDQMKKPTSLSQKKKLCILEEELESLD